MPTYRRYSNHMASFMAKSGSDRDSLVTGRAQIPRSRGGHDDVMLGSEWCDVECVVTVSARAGCDTDRGGLVTRANWTYEEVDIHHRLVAGI